MAPYRAKLAFCSPKSTYSQRPFAHTSRAHWAKASAPVPSSVRNMLITVKARPISMPHMPLTRQPSRYMPSVARKPRSRTSR